MLTDKQSANVALLIKALISGDYKQCRKKLYDPVTEQHDILGVAARLFGFPEVSGVFYFGGHNDWPDYSSKYAISNRWFRTCFGLDMTKLVLYNDDYGWSFNQLACHLLQFLPKSPSKSLLQTQILEQLRLDAQRQNNWVKELRNVAP